MIFRIVSSELRVSAGSVAAFVQESKEKALSLNAYSQWGGRGKVVNGRGNLEDSAFVLFRVTKATMVLKMMRDQTKKRRRMESR